MPKRRRGRIDNFNKGGKKWAIGTAAHTAACKLGYNWVKEKGENLTENNNPESASTFDPSSDASPVADASVSAHRVQSIILGNSSVPNTPSCQKSPVFWAFSPVLNMILSPFHSPSTRSSSPLKFPNNHSHAKRSTNSPPCEPSVMFLNDSVSDMGIPHESEPKMLTDPAFLDGEISVPREEESDKESISTIFSDGDSSILDFDSSGHFASWAL
ncbi:hypothetical protein C8R41DRAFT_978642 [Lentinula lateritia]|uniref:Uncharacterized protein n=1 Tax=Lentinula lateritia TaxID=40482 RepID=A0ABQ8VR27_9AGAR|nr:hypothetical protein C8R41DRAFT_978642 [Lentinula lateritia]